MSLAGIPETGLVPAAVVLTACYQSALTAGSLEELILTSPRDVGADSNVLETTVQTGANKQRE